MQAGQKYVYRYTQTIDKIGNKTNTDRHGTGNHTVRKVLADLAVFD